ncbi:hypothetical protein IWX90DRAFT_173285 [Phyllosticta citrichinensis]|uniref:F-box domain-containing protein n=1 Tax=Phyllosticta citrichinensis TaxID=1130410 RepID=A0ABR1XV90_9PEZI
MPLIPAIEKHGLFGRLPGEIQNKIFRNLDYRSAIFLAATSSYFRDDVKLLVLVSDEEKLACLRDLEKLPQNDSSFSCTKCWRLKPRTAFGIKQLLRKRGKGNSQSHKRFCIECGMAGIFSPGSLVWPSDPVDSQYPHQWVCCNATLQRTGACGSCSKCSLCLIWGECSSFCFECNRLGYCTRGHVRPQTVNESTFGGDVAA